MVKDLAILEGVNINRKKILVGFRQMDRSYGVIFKTEKKKGKETLWPDGLSSFHVCPVAAILRVTNTIKHNIRKSDKIYKKYLDALTQFNQITKTYTRKRGFEFRQVKALKMFYWYLTSGKIPFRFLSFESWRPGFSSPKILKSTQMYYVCFDERLISFLKLKGMCPEFIRMAEELEENQFSKSISLGDWVEDRTNKLLQMSEEELMKELK